MGERWLEVPVGHDAERWVTMPARRTVLVVVQSMVSGVRLMDLVPLLEADQRIQVLFTAAPSSAYWHGGVEYVNGVGGLVLPWEQAIRTRFDLVLAASLGATDQVLGPLVVMPHGVGYNGYRPVRPGSGLPARRPLVGLSAEGLVRDGRVIPSAIVLSHQEQLARLAEECPDALPAAVVAGDPCLDRIRASMPYRPEYRRALGVADGERLVVVTSTWGRGSLFARQRPLLLRLVQEARRRRCRVAAILHPNIWYAHGPRQVRGWLGDCLRSGLILVPPEEGWRATVVAADWIVGDHGSVTQYGAATGAPVLLGAFATGKISPTSTAALLARVAPRLGASGDLFGQLDRAATHHDPQRYQRVIDSISSLPGEAIPLILSTLYSTMGLAASGTRLVAPPVPHPVPVVDTSSSGW